MMFKDFSADSGLRHESDAGKQVGSSAGRTDAGAGTASTGPSVPDDVRQQTLQQGQKAWAGLKRPMADRTFSAPPYSRWGDLTPPADVSYWGQRQAGAAAEGSFPFQSGSPLRAIADGSSSGGERHGSLKSASDSLLQPLPAKSPLKSSSAAYDPLRSPFSPTFAASPLSASTTSAGLSHLIAETLQMPIATLLQLLPPHLLDPSHERFSSTALQLPVTSVGAVLEGYKVVNWLCSNAAAEGGSSAPATPTGVAASAEKSDAIPPRQRAPSIQLDGLDILPAPIANDAAASGGLKLNTSGAAGLPSTTSTRSGGGEQGAGGRNSDFDLLELVQRVADAVSGQTASKDIDVVLLNESLLGHEHTAAQEQNAPVECSVRGDQGAIRFGIMHVSRVH